MSNCKQCGKELVHVQGRREKMYCDVTCKAAWFNKNKPRKARYVLLSTHEAVIKERDKYKELLLNATLSVHNPSDGSKYATNKEKPNPDNPDQPTKMIGESSLDFNIRLAEWKENNNHS